MPGLRASHKTVPSKKTPLPIARARQCRFTPHPLPEEGTGGENGPGGEAMDSREARATVSSPGLATTWPAPPTGRGAHDVELRREFLHRVNAIPGVSIPDDAITRRPSIPLALFAADPKALEALKATLDWFCETVRSDAED